MMDMLRFAFAGGFWRWFGTAVLLTAPIAVLCDGIAGIIRAWRGR